MSVMLNKIHHTGFIVSNLDDSLRFYNRLLGQEPKLMGRAQNNPGFDQQTETPGSDARIAFYEIGDCGLELIEFVSPAVPKDQVSLHTPGSKHLAFQTDDLEKTYAAMQADGYDAFIAPPVHFGSSDGTLDGIVFAYFRDPDGNVLELFEEPGKIGLPTA